MPAPEGAGLKRKQIRCFACSASTRFLGLDPGTVQQSVDAILGWQSMAKMIEASSKIVTF